MNKIKIKKVYNQRPDGLWGGVPSVTIRAMRVVGKRIILAAIIALVLAVGAGVYAYWQASHKNTVIQKKTIKVDSITITRVCTNAMVTRVGQAIADNDIPAMRTVYDEFKSNPSYTGDATCNYIATRYFIATGNSAEARKHLDALKLGISAGDVISKSFSPPAQPVDELEAMVKELSLIQQGSSGMSTSSSELDEIDKRGPQ